MVIIILVLCVVCTHVYTSIPGSMVPNSLLHDINTRGVTPAKCVISLSLSILVLGFPAKWLMTLTRGILSLCSVSLNFHCQSRLHDPSEFYSWEWHEGCHPCAVCHCIFTVNPGHRVPGDMWHTLTWGICHVCAYCKTYGTKCVILALAIGQSFFVFAE